MTMLTHGKMANPLASVLVPSYLACQNTNVCIPNVQTWKAREVVPQQTLLRACVSAHLGHEMGHDKIEKAVRPQAASHTLIQSCLLQ